MCFTIHHTPLRGRNTNLLQSRNYKIVVRYYYWHDLMRIRRDDVIVKLSTEEFYLQPYTINCILRDNTNLIKQLRREKPEARKLQHITFGIN